MIETLAFYCFSLVLVAASVMVVSARNPVYSVLFLILAFFNSAALFLMLGAEFLAMILVIVYVGAVAVLFLFVVMMLDINFAELRGKFSSYLPVGLLVGTVLLAQLFILIRFMDMDGKNYVSAPVKTNESLTNTQQLGQVLYTDYFYLFQLSGMVLLLAMVSAIVLTLRQRAGVKRQDPGKQSIRTREQTVSIQKVKTGEGIK